jgi:hypothetical protein
MRMEAGAGQSLPTIIFAENRKMGWAPPMTISVLLHAKDAGACSGAAEGKRAREISVSENSSQPIENARFVRENPRTSKLSNPHDGRQRGWADAGA